MKDAWDKFAIVAGVLQILAWVVCIIVISVILSGCGNSPPNDHADASASEPDSGADAGIDASVDAGSTNPRPCHYDCIPIGECDGWIHALSWCLDPGDYCCQETMP